MSSNLIFLVVKKKSSESVDRHLLFLLDLKVK